MGEGVGIGQHLVHAAMLRVEHALHLLVGEAGGDVDGPVAEPEEQFLGLLVAAVDVGVAQSGIHLVQVVESDPCAGVGTEVAFPEGAPYLVAVGHSAHVAPSPFRMVARVGIGAGLQLANHVFHPLLALLASGAGVEGQGGEVVSSHMSVESVPVGV